MEQRYVSKRDWEAFQAGILSYLPCIGEPDLHHVFGDDPYKHVVRVTITANKAGPEDGPLKTSRTGNIQRRRPESATSRGG